MIPVQKPPQLPGKEEGFTLIELLITVAILAVLATIAVPSFNNIILSNKLTAYANNFVSSALLARSEAIKRNAIVSLCRSADGASCATSGDWQQGWIIFHDVDADGTVDSGETIIQIQSALSTDYHFSGGSYQLNFPGSGIGNSLGTTLTLCRATPSAGNQERVITVSATGRPSVATTKTGSCP